MQIGDRELTGSTTAGAVRRVVRQREARAERDIRPGRRRSGSIRVRGAC